MPKDEDKRPDDMMNMPLGDGEGASEDTFAETDALLQEFEKVSFLSVLEGGDRVKSAFEKLNRNVDKTKTELNRKVDTDDPRLSASGMGGPHDHNSAYYTKTQMDNFLTGKSDTTHNHSGVYSPTNHTHSEYATSSALTSGLAGKSDTSHLHDARYVRTVNNTAPDGSGNVTVAGGGGGGTSDHGALTGLDDDDHTQYLNNTRGDARYYTKSQVDTSLSGKANSAHTHDDRYFTETEINTKLDDYLSDAEFATAIADYATTSSVNSGLAGKANTNHNHDDRYYTETEIDTQMSGKASTSHNHDSAYYTKTQSDSALAGKSDTTHNHDSRYYTETEVDTLLSGKSSTSHNHNGVYQPAGTYITAHRAIPIAFALGGNLAVDTRTPYFDVNASYSINRIKGRLVSASAGASVNVSLYKRVSGSDSLVGSLSFTAGNTTATATGISASVSDGDSLWIRVDQVGSTTAGEGLSVMVELI